MARVENGIDVGFKLLKRDVESSIVQQGWEEYQKNNLRINVNGWQRGDKANGYTRNN